MNTIVRAGLVLIILIAGLGGCSGTGTAADAVAARISPRPSPAGLDDYKTRVARHVTDHNPERAYPGTLPAMLPAIVVLKITVGRDGQLADVAVQRSRDPDASAIALASMRRSAPLPPPPRGRLTFFETFLFADSKRYQLRSLAGPQASE
jgi:protein TonB